MIYFEKHRNIITYNFYFMTKEKSMTNNFIGIFIVWCCFFLRRELKMYFKLWISVICPFFNCHRTHACHNYANRCGAKVSFSYFLYKVNFNQTAHFAFDCNVNFLLIRQRQKNTILLKITQYRKKRITFFKALKKFHLGLQFHKMSESFNFYSKY